MSVSKYEAFVACAEDASFTRAAQRLGYTQSAVSQLVHNLETELGVRLLSRENHRAELTAEGRILLPYAKSLLAANKDLKDQAEELASLHTGKVSIGAVSSIVLRKLPEVLRRFRNEYPGIEVNVTGASYSEIEKKLLEKQIDIGFVSGESLREFQTFPYVRDRLMLVMPEDVFRQWLMRNNSKRKSQDEETDKRKIKKENIEKTDSCINPSELAAYEFILPAEGDHYDIGALFARYGLSPVIRFRMEDDYAALELVRQGFGVTILPELLLEAYAAKGIRALPILDTERQIFVAINRSRVMSAAVRTMLQMLQEDSTLP